MLDYFRRILNYRIYSFFNSHPFKIVWESFSHEVFQDNFCQLLFLFSFYLGGGVCFMLYGIDSFCLRLRLGKIFLALFQKAQEPNLINLRLNTFFHSDCSSVHKDITLLIRVAFSWSNLSFVASWIAWHGGNRWFLQSIKYLESSIKTITEPGLEFSSVFCPRSSSSKQWKHYPSIPRLPESVKAPKCFSKTWSKTPPDFIFSD